MLKDECLSWVWLLFSSLYVSLLVYSVYIIFIVANTCLPSFLILQLSINSLYLHYILILFLSFPTLSIRLLFLHIWSLIVIYYSLSFWKFIRDNIVSSLKVSNVLIAELYSSLIVLINFDVFDGFAILCRPL